MGTELDTILAYLAEHLLSWKWSECDNTETYHRHNSNCPYSWTFKEPGETHSYEIGLKYILTGNGMLEIIEAMRESWLYEIQSIGGDVKHGAAFTKLWFSESELQLKAAATMPEAVARAAYAALQDSL